MKNFAICSRAGRIVPVGKHAWIPLEGSLLARKRTSRAQFVVVIDLRQTFEAALHEMPGGAAVPKPPRDLLEARPSHCAGSAGEVRDDRCVEPGLARIPGGVVSRANEV